MFSDPIHLDLMSRIRSRPAAGLLKAHPSPPEKAAFSPAPGVQQAVMGQAQAGPPPGMDPAAGGAPPGMPPGAGAPPGPPPGMDPMAGGAPPPDPNVPAAPSPVEAKLDQMMGLLQQYSQAGGMPGAGPGGKPPTTSLKLEPQHFHEVKHDISNIKAVLVQMADQMGLQIPASELLNQPAPGQAAAPPGAPPGGDPGAGPPPGPPPFAQKLPPLPPAVAKAAADSVARTPLMTEALDRLGAGYVVGGSDSPAVSAPSRATHLAAFAAKFSRGG